MKLPFFPLTFFSIQRHVQVLRLFYLPLKENKNRKQHDQITLQSPHLFQQLVTGQYISPRLGSKDAMQDIEGN
jgi:hypothetical protein